MIEAPSCTCSKLANVNTAGIIEMTFLGPICEKKNRHVFRTMHALYDIKTGTCFDEKK